MLSSITRCLHPKCVNRTQIFSTNFHRNRKWIYSYKLNDFLFEFLLMLYNEIDEILCIYKQKKKRGTLCWNVEHWAGAINTSKKRRKKKKKITHRVFGLLALPASLLRISYQILTQVQYESALSSSFYFYYCFKIRGVSSN